MEEFLWLLPIGFLTGGYGTVIGTGGGFVLVPVLLLLYPEQSAATIAGISLAVVFFNASSGVIAYARMRRIEYKSGFLFSSAAVPGAVLGALSTAYIPRRLFDFTLALLIVVLCVFLSIRTLPKPRKVAKYAADPLCHPVSQARVSAGALAYDRRLGIGLSSLVGYVSSVLGIGGGIIHVPAMVFLLNFPPHLAVATSLFILMVTALLGSIVHVATGQLPAIPLQAVSLAAGAAIGAQAGARLSGYLNGVWIVRGLAAALGLAGVRLLLQAFLT